MAADEAGASKSPTASDPVRPDCGVIGLSQPSTRRSFAEETLTFAEQQREDDRRYSSMRPSRTRVLMS